MLYEYDPFQKKSIEAVNKGHSVLVSAPTGSGKTAIAEYVIERALEKGERVVYTAPIKAISNQKYRDFIVNYPGKVGLLTGDVSIDPDALVLIMTTEIYRNQLFENPEKHRNTSWVIFDEVHYLDDYERGTVWEEAIMFSHPQTKFLCLSATAPNIAELAQWIESVHQHAITVVIESQRPVELRHHFQCQNLIYDDVHRLKKDGYMGQNLWASGRGHGGGGRGGRHPRGRMHHGGWQRELRAKPNSTHDLLRHLIERDRLPCLYFAFGRKRVEELAHEHMHLNLLSPEDRDINRMQYDQLVKKYDLELEKSAVEMGRLVEHGIAFHHAGMLPTLKEVVERLFTAKRIRLIFTTETFALGINMPARTVVFDELRKFYGFGFDNLTTRDYFQMAGRAGRRGIDDTGFVYSRVNPHFISIQAISRVVHGDMEPIMSQFNASYATLLNLYRHLGRRLVDVYPKSLHYFQSQAKKQRKALEKIEHKLELLTRMGYLTEAGGQTPISGGLTPKGEFASCMYGYELILSELLESGFLNHLNATELCVLVAALVYEPRKNEMLHGFPAQYHHLEKQARRVLKKIHEFELGLGISPETKEPHFHLTAAMEAWMQGVDFHEMGKYTDIDEGIIIRYFRMVIQILRQLESAPAVTPALRELTFKALPLVNRDIVDAEKLLRSL